MKNISTGTGIALLAGAIAAYPILDRVMPKADASATHTAAVIAAATAQVEPTIVWYQAVGTGGDLNLLRAWSDGRIEIRRGHWSNCGPNRIKWAWADPTGWGTSMCDGTGVGDWHVISSPNSGFSSAADINFDSKVDGADLGQLLTAWGDAPRQDIPPSDCPLNLVTP
jgi:hypothetical protein